MMLDGSHGPRAACGMYERSHRCQHSRSSHGPSTTEHCKIRSPFFYVACVILSSLGYAPGVCSNRTPLSGLLCPGFIESLVASHCITSSWRPCPPSPLVVALVVAPIPCPAKSTREVKERRRRFVAFEFTFPFGTPSSTTLCEVDRAGWAASAAAGRESELGHQN
jgi:hypothetical protein